MNPESIIPFPDTSRYSNSDNPLVAFEFLVICALCLYILFRDRQGSKERKETNETLSEVAAAVNILTGVINAKK